MAAPKKKYKRLLYLRALFNNEQYASLPQKTLEEYLRAAYKKLYCVKDRVVAVAQQHWQGTYYLERNDSFSFQFAVCTPGENTSVILTGDLTAESIEMGVVVAPDGAEFSDGDAVCCVSGNHIFACFSLLREGTIVRFLRELFKKADLDDRALNVEISKPIDFNKLKMIKNAGVKSIELDISLDKNDYIELGNIRKNHWGARLVRAIAEKDMSFLEAAKQSDTHLKIELLMNKGKSKEKAIDLAWGNKLAEEAIEEMDDYKIILLDGNVITPSQITVARNASFEPFGKSIFVKEAIEKLEEFKNGFLDTTR